MFGRSVKKVISAAFGHTKRLADVGVEVELEGEAFPSAIPQYWTAHSEGSIQGMEYVTKPIKVDVVKGQVEYLSKYLRDCGAFIQNSHRTSTHVHLNMSGETFETVLGMLTIFTMYEPLLLRLCGPQRDGNLFCLSSYDTGDITQYFQRFCKALDKLEKYGWGMNGRGKYSSLNTGRLYDLGTLEARCFPASLDGAEITKWCTWLLQMRDMARSEPDKSFRSLWKAVRMQPEWFAHKIFGAEGSSHPECKELIAFGTENAYELTRVLKHWHNKPVTGQEEEAKPKMKKALSWGAQPGSPSPFTVSQGVVFSNGSLGWPETVAIPVEPMYNTDDTEF